MHKFTWLNSQADNWCCDYGAVFVHLTILNCVFVSVILQIQQRPSDIFMKSYENFTHRIQKYNFPVHIALLLEIPPNTRGQHNRSDIG